MDMSLNTTNATDKPVLLSTRRLVFIFIAYAFILLFGVLGNTFVILAVVLSRKLRTFTNIFVVNLSISDLCSNIFVIFLFAGDNFILCSIATFTIMISVQCSTLNIAAIALNRYIVLTRTTNPTSKYKKFFASPLTNIVMVAATWIIPILLDLVPTFVGSFGDERPGSPLSGCNFYMWPASNIHSYLIGVTILVPLLTTVVCYGLILRFVRRHFSNQKASLEDDPNRDMDIAVKGQTIRRISELEQQQFEITKNLFVVVVIFSLLVMPSALARFWPDNKVGLFITGILIFASSAINPVIYVRKHPHFRAVLVAMLKCRCRDIPEKPRFLEQIMRSHETTFV